MAQQPAEATVTHLEGFDLVLSRSSTSGYMNVSLRAGQSEFVKRPYHARVEAGYLDGTKTRAHLSLGYHATAAEAALAVAKYRSGHGTEPNGSPIRKRHKHQQRATPSATMVTCAAVEVEDGDFCHLAAARLLQNATPWHMQALLADFGAQTDGTPQELARRLAEHLGRQ